MDDYDDEDLVFSGTSGAPLNAADAARRLLEETDGLVVPPETVIAPGSGGSINKASHQAVSSSTTNIIAERLAQMRTSGGKLMRQPGTLQQQQQQPVVVRSSEIDVGYKAPLMTSTTIKKDLYADHPISGGATKSTAPTTTSSYGVSSSSTHFAPVDLAPPPTMSASSYMYVNPLQQPPRAISSSMDIEEDIIDTSSTPFLSSRERQTASPSNTAASKLMAFMGQLQLLVSPLVTKFQSVISTWLDKASSLNAQEWKKIALQGVLLVTGFIFLRWVFLKFF